MRTTMLTACSAIQTCCAGFSAVSRIISRPSCGASCCNPPKQEDKQFCCLPVAHAPAVVTTAAKKQNQHKNDQKQFHRRLHVTRKKLSRNSDCCMAENKEWSDDVRHHERDDDDSRDAQQPKNDWHVSLQKCDQMNRTHQPAAGTFGSIVADEEVKSRELRLKRKKL